MIVEALRAHSYSGTPVKCSHKQSNLPIFVASESGVIFLSEGLNFWLTYRQTTVA